MNSNCLFRIAMAAVTFAATQASAFAAAPAGVQLDSTVGVKGFYAEHCVRCHKEGKAKGGFRMDELLARATIEGHDDPWKNVLEKLAGREMPPDDEEKRPSHADFEKQIAWLRGELEKSEQLTASVRPQAQRRLNRAEYNRTVSDLFGVALRPADDFPPDDKLHGFDTVAEGLNTSTVLLDRYLAAAQDIARRVTEPAAATAPEATVFSVSTDPGPDQKSSTALRVYDGNLFFYLGGANPQAWLSRDWIGHSWGANWQPRHSGRYTITLRGRQKHFAPGELGIYKLEVGGRTVGVFSTAQVPRPDEKLFETTLWVDKSIKGPDSVIFTFVNGNPYGTAVGEGEDYHPNSFNRYRKMKIEHFPELTKVPGSPYNWMPSEPPCNDVLAVADARCEISGPHYDAWPPVGFQRTFAAALKAQDLRAVVAGVLPNAFRRPVQDAEIAGIVKFAETSQPADAPFTDKLQAALTRILVAPEFLFLLEPVPPGTLRGAYQLTNWELAARLSYFLTGTTPDAPLRAAAARGELSDAVKLDAQVTRLLRDPRCIAALTDGFLTSWLHLDRLATVMPEPKLFKNFGDDLKRSMGEEPKAFFAALLRDNGQVTDLLDSNYSWVNERLAIHYGLDRASIRGSGMRRVELPSRERGGLLGMAGILTLTSEATRTSPVKRGIFVLENLFNRPPPPPPPNVGDLIPNTASAKSMREHLARHREDAACAGCHARIDPWGLALENYDAVGAWRSGELAWEDPSRPTNRKKGEAPPSFLINTSFALPIMSDAAKRETGVEAARAELLHRRDDFARGLTEKLMTYALGRGLLLSDHKHVGAATAALKKDDYHLHALIRAIVQSPAFRTR